MRKQIFVDDPAEFQELRVRATAGLRMLQCTSQNEVVYFDSAIVTTRHFFKFVRDLFRFTNATADGFAFVGLRPDPLGYFFNHLSRFPAIIFQPTDSEADYCTMLQADPGGSPADALAFNTWAYVVLPSSGDWIAYGDDSNEIAVFSGAPEKVNEFARTTLARDIVRPAADFNHRLERNRRSDTEPNEKGASNRAFYLMRHGTASTSHYATAPFPTRSNSTPRPLTPPAPAPALHGYH